MSDWNPNSVLGRDIDTYNRAVGKYRKKAEWYNGLATTGSGDVAAPNAPHRYQTVTETVKDPESGEDRQVQKDVPVLMSEVEAMKPKPVFRGITEQQKAESAPQPTLTDHIRSGSGLLSRILGRKDDE